MTKAEFLNSLRTKLAGEVTDAELESTIRYYDEYISEAVGAGKTEGQVLSELGNPFLIARTIIDTSEKRETQGKKADYDEKAGGFERKAHVWGTGTPPGASRVVKVLLILAALMAVAAVLKMLIPILIPVVLIWIVAAAFRGKTGR